MQVVGSKNAKQVLTNIYADPKADLSITTEVVSGCDAAPLGNLVLAAMEQGTNAISVPMAIYMGFDRRTGPDHDRSVTHDKRRSLCHSRRQNLSFKTALIAKLAEGLATP